MQEELSMNSYAKVFNTNEESEDSYSNIYSSQAHKRSRAENNVSLPRFKGVVPQQNGHWGAQIYANHQRIWLGTFKSEIDAAKAYDSAAIKLRGRDSDRNFPWTNITVQEPIFQSHYTVEEILNLIKDGSYPSKFAHFLTQRRDEELDQNLAVVHGNGGLSCRLLFQKELTPSDVGKLNRLVIPKKYAIKYFPNIAETESTEEDESISIVDDVQLVFYDRLMRLWKFRYCYWKSSQSYVFTRGWNRFVREKDLKSNDTVAFYVYEKVQGPKQGQTFFVIDVGYKGGMNNVGLGQTMNNGLIKEEAEEIEDQKQSVGSSSECHVDKKGFKLFGVHIL